MHSSAFRIGGKFLANYFQGGMTSILEIGAYDVNGSLRSQQPLGSRWIGVDIENGPGVDIVVEPGAPLPFADNSFDLVLATSVFEHDPAFWKTVKEMARVASPNGFIYISAPSNGLVHRYPLDCFRFYPDAGISFLESIKEVKPRAALAESFVGEQDHEKMWNDFVAVFAMSLESSTPEKIHTSENCTNVWSDGNFKNETLMEIPEDQRLAKSNAEHVEKLEAELSNLRQQLELMVTSKSWKLTEPLRNLARKRI